MNTPFFSVIIPVYNREKYISKALDSVLSQTMEDFECIIVDDGSEDSTCEVLKKYRDKRIKILSQKNSGPSAARNRGISEASGRFISFLDSDDWWKKDKLKVTYQAIQERPDIKIFHTLERWYRGGVHLNQKKKHRPPTGEVFGRALKICSISLSTATIRYDVFEKYGLFDESFPACEDYEFWLRITSREKVHLIEEVLTEKEGGHKDQQSKKYPAMDLFRIRAICKALESGILDEEKYQLALKELKVKCNIYGLGAQKRGRLSEAEKYFKLHESYIWEE
ncbi:MAG: glycosyltransferase [Elusimicrobia bacterium]|nr:glycosyltransferase [Elusimicrobiota bacterium]